MKKLATEIKVILNKGCSEKGSNLLLWSIWLLQPALVLIVLSSNWDTEERTDTETRLPPSLQQRWT